jgi:simple sugar transport system permease protein
MSVVASFSTVIDISFFQLAITAATPILFVALGETVAERSGVMNISTEGMMLSGALAGMAVSVETGSVILGILAALGVGCITALVLAIWSVSFRANQIVVGIVINLIAAGATTLIYQIVFPQSGGAVVRTPSFGRVNIPGVPDSGPASLLQQNILVYVAIALVPLLAYFIFRTPAGLLLRSTGEKALAADTAGVQVFRIRYVAVLFGGAMAALGGAYLSLVETHAFQPDMTAGRGFIGLAVVMVAKWNPWGALGLCLLFGGAESFEYRAQGLSLGVPPLLFTLLPYILTLVVLVVTSGRVAEPRDLTKPYLREQQA